MANIGPTEAMFSWAFGDPGQKPVVPDLPTTQEIAKKAVDANVANFEDIRGLAQKYNSASIEDLKTTLEKISPGSTQLLEQGTQFISSLMRGEIPQDVSDQVARLGASKAMGGGYFGSGMARNLVARDLGTTSLNLMQQGMGSAERWLQQLSGMAPRFNYASMFVTPQFQMGWEEQKWQRDWLANQIAASPSPDQQAWNQMMGSFGYGIDYIGSSIVQMYTGGGPANIGGQSMGTGGNNWDTNAMRNYDMSQYFSDAPENAYQNPSNWMDAPDSGGGGFGGFGGGGGGGMGRFSSIMGMV